jgi:hypothetical protein
VVLARPDVSGERSASMITVRRLLVTANVSCSSIHVTLMMDGLLSFEMSVLAGATLCNIPEEDNLHFQILYFR